MTTILALLVSVLLASVAIGLYRVARGPSPADAMLAVLLIGTTGTAVTVLLGPLLDVPGAIDIALTLALLAAVIGVAFVKHGWPGDAQ